MDLAVPLEVRRIDLSVEPPFQLGRARVDPPAHEITLGGKSERIQPQTLKVLVALHDKKAEVVTRDELVARCWDGRIVGDDVINRCISLLRRFEGENGGFAIETVPKAGYRLVETAAGQSSRKYWPLIAGVALIAAFAVVLFLAGRTGRQGKPASPTIALLPFVADASDPEARKLALAAREALAHTLSEGQFTLKLVDTAQKGRAAADFVISGQLSANADKAVAVVRMEDTVRHAVVFTDQFEANDQELGDLPERMGAQVAAQLSWTAPMIVIDLRHPSDPAVTAQILEGVSSLNSDLGVLQKYENAQRLVRKAPNSGLAQMSLAFFTAFSLSEIPNADRARAVAIARGAADRAITLMPDYGDVYISRCILHSPVRMRECEAGLRAAMRIDPDGPFINAFLSDHLSRVGRNKEAAELAALSLAHDQYMPTKIARVLQMREATGQLVNAAELYRQAIRWWPNQGEIIWSRWAGMLARGDFKSIERFEKDLPAEQRSPPELLTAILAGDLAAAQKSCREPSGQAALTCMIGLAHLGDADGALALTDRLYPNLRGRSAADEDALWLDNLDGPPIAFLSSPAAAPLRRDPRFLPVAARVGLLEYWRTVRLPDFCTIEHEPVCVRIARAA